MIYQPALMRDEQFLLDIEKARVALNDREAALFRELNWARYDAQKAMQRASANRAIAILEAQFRGRRE